MIHSIINFSIRNKLIIGLFTISLVIVGIFEVARLPIDAVPDITDNQVQVITVASSYGASDIERLVTFPLEQAFSNIDGIKQIRSFSRFGLSLVTIVFEDDIDIHLARQQVSERLQKIQAEIPREIGIPEMGPITTGLGEIYQYVVHPLPGYEDEFDAMELRTIQDWYVRRQLLNVKGVAEVSSFGGKLKQYEVAINATALQSFGLSISDVFEALEKNNQNTGGSYIEKGPIALYIRTEGLLKSVEEIENIAVTVTENRIPVRIKDIANVQIGHATRFGAMLYNDQGEVAGGIVMMLKGANSNQVIKDVKAKISEIQASLPEGVTIEPFLDRTKMVNNAIKTVKTNLLEGALIVIFILVIFLGNIRAGFLVASVIPLAMLFAIIMMNFFGVSGNLMSLGALDFGLIVDGAVIIVEAVLHRLSHSGVFSQTQLLSREEMDRETGKAAGKMMSSAIFGQVIILIVYIPVLTLQGIEGKMFKPMAETVSFALIGAFILSFTYVPMMSALILSRRKPAGPTYSDRAMEYLSNGYQKALRISLNHSGKMLLLVFSMLVVSLFLLSRMGGEFIPELEEGDFAVDTRVLTGSNLQTTIQYTTMAAGLLKERFPEVEKVVTKIGSGEVPTDPMPMEASDMMVILKNKKEWTSAESFPEMAEKMNAVLKEIPGISVGFQFPVQMRFNELMTGARQDVVCKIFGEDLDTLSKYAAEIGRLASGVQGAEDIYVEPVSGIPQIIIDYNRDALSALGLDVQLVNRMVKTAFAGESTGWVFEGEKRFNLVVRSDPQFRHSKGDIENLLIPLPHGGAVNLASIADINEIDGPNQIQRENTRRRIITGFNIRGRDVQSVVKELEDKIKTQIHLPYGYSITYGGSFQNLEEAKSRLMIAVPMALALIFILLFFAFRSVKLGLLIYTAIPLSAIGGILLLWLRNMPFSISAGVGFIALFGVAVLNGIVLIAEFERRKKSESGELKDIVIHGATTRLRPVLMTAMVASFGFLPMAISNGAGAEVQRPLATVVIGGLMLATFLTLFVLPMLYIILEKVNFRPRRKTAVVAMLLLVKLSSTPMLKAQSIPLHAAIDSAIANNYQSKNTALIIQYREIMTKTARDIPQALVENEFGQINSAFFDHRVNVSQSFSLPAVYRENRKMLQEEAFSAAISQSLNAIEIKRMVTGTYYSILCLREKRAILSSADSLLVQFITKADARKNSGESNVLEKAAAQRLRGQLQMQILQLKYEEEAENLLFRLLLNTDQPLLPAQAPVKYLSAPETMPDSTAHPIIKLYAQEIAIAKARVEVEKNTLLPTLNAGYSNQNITGTGADDILYPRSKRFQTFQLGVGIPLFFGANKAKVEAAKKWVSVKENEYAWQSAKIKTEISTLLMKLTRLNEMIALYDNELLPVAKLIQNTLSNQLRAGEINYLEWVLLNQQALQTQSEYLDIIQQFNDTHIMLTFYLEN